MCVFGFGRHDELAAVGIIASLSRRFTVKCIPVSNKVDGVGESACAILSLIDEYLVVILKRILLSHAFEQSHSLHVSAIISQTRLETGHRGDARVSHYEHNPVLLHVVSSALTSHFLDCDLHPSQAEEVEGAH